MSPPFRIFCWLIVLAMGIYACTAQAAVGPIAENKWQLVVGNTIVNDGGHDTFQQCDEARIAKGVELGLSRTSGQLWLKCQKPYRYTFVADQPQPVDCVVSWPEWPAECPASGVRVRTGIVITQPANGGAACPSLTETQSCTPPNPGTWPQPPMPGMPVVSAVPYIQITEGKDELLIGSAGAVGSPGPDVGAFRLSCRPSHMAYDDPLLYPGASNSGRSHHHTFFGNDGVTAATNLDNLRNIGGSTCHGGSANKSAYWVPSVIDTRTGKPIVPHSIQAYYKSGYHDMPRESVQPFPVGLKLLGGTPTATTEGGYIGHWHCHYDGGNSGPDISGPTIPACPFTPNPDPRWFASGTTVWAQIEMPNCWDGRNLDSPDHKSHMTSSKWHGNRCPASHPVLITTITFNILYPVNESDDASKWKLSSDMGAPGLSFHADWINGWDPAIESVWLNNCVRAGRDCGSNNLGDGRGLDP